MEQEDRIKALIDDYLASDPDGMAFVRNLYGDRAAMRTLWDEGSEPSVPSHLLCPSCERRAITRNGRCEDCQWAVL